MVSATLQQELKTLEGAVRAIRQVVSSVPRDMRGDQAQSFVTLLSQAERTAASGIALLTPAVVKDGSFATSGHASAADWLGAISGSSAGVAKGRLVAAERAAASPELAEALHDGHLSSAQLKIVAETTAVDPAAPGQLLALVDDHASLQQLSDAASRIRASARSRENDRQQRQRVHAYRHFRWHQDQAGGIRGEMYCDEAQWARISPALEAEAKARFKAAGAGGDSLEAHRLDAFIDFMARAGGSGAAGSGPRTHHRAIVIVDAEALRRGTTQGDELCEIDGIGPVGVEAATELIGESSLQFVIKDGVDIRTVTGTSRTIAQRIHSALLVRDRTCVVPHCGKRFGLELDHCTVDFRDDGPTELSNLARLCAACHNMKTNGGWKLGGGPGHWTWDPPPKPPSARRIARSRKLTTAKARAKAIRNKPLRA